MLKFFMKKRLLFITFLLIGLCTIILIRLNSTIFLDQQKLVYDNLNKILNSTIDSVKQDALSFSLAATSFPTLKEAILLKDQKVVMEILNELNDNINKSFKNEKINIQILTQDFLYCTQAQKDFSKENYKEYVQAVFNELQHNNSSLIQTHNAIKIRTPIMDSGKVIAFFDIQIMFDVVVQNMRKHKIEVITILDETKNDIASFTKESIKINAHYFVVNDNYNKILLGQLTSLNSKDIQELFDKEYIFKNELFYALYDIKNMQGVSLGKFIAIVNPKMFDTISNKEDSFLRNIVTINNTSEDFYNFVKHKEENMFLNIEKGYIKNLKDVVDEKDKNEFEEIARQKLLNLSKEELVDFILQQSKHSEIKGQIR